MVDKSRMTRRSALCFIGGGTIVAASGGFETFGFSDVTAVRESVIDSADDSDALLGLFVPDSIERKGRSVLVEITNNLTADIDGTVSLSEGQGTLYDPNGNPGDPASFSLVGSTENTTDSAIIEIDPENYEGPIRFEITAAAPNGAFSFEGTRETESVKDPEGSGVTITDSGQFKAKHSKDYWEVKDVAVSSDEFELDRVEYEVRDSSNSVVGTHVDDASGTTYNSGTIEIYPDDGGVNNADYTLQITAYDSEGNYDIATATT